MDENLANNVMFGTNFGSNSKPDLPEPEKKRWYQKPILWWSIILLIFLIILSVRGFALDKASLCGNLSITSINDCDEFWNLLNSNNTIIQNYTITTILNETIYINNTEEINLDILKERNRHDEQIAKIDKGIIDNNGSQSIITSDFAKQSELQNSIENAFSVVVKKDELQTKLEEFYLQKFGNSTLQQQTSTQKLKWYETQSFIIIVILLILVGIWLYQRRGRYKATNAPQIDKGANDFFKDLAKNIKKKDEGGGSTQTIETELTKDKEEGVD